MTVVTVVTVVTSVAGCAIIIIISGWFTAKNYLLTVSRESCAPPTSMVSGP